jgi:hypothetical protein
MQQIPTMNHTTAALITRQGEEGFVVWGEMEGIRRLSATHMG